MLLFKGSLKDALNKSGPFSINVVAKYARQILEGLDFLHGHKVIHRDIKGTASLLRVFFIFIISGQHS